MAQKKYLDYAGLESILTKLNARQFFGNMGLSEENFTAALKTRYDNLVAGSASSADLEALTTRVTALESLIEVDETAAIDKFKEIVNFLAGIENTETLDGLLGDISAQVTVAKETADAAKAKAEANATAIGGKANKATTLAGYGITDAKIVGDTVTLGGTSKTFLTSHQSLADYAKTADVNSALDGKADSASTLAGYGIVDACIKADNTIQLGSKTIKPLTSHQSLEAYATTASMNTALDDKVDKVAGKGLSANDYTTAEKNAVATIANKVNESDLVAISTEEITNLLKA